MRRKNLIVKDWRKTDLTFGLVYPNIYKIGMSSYAIRLIYSLINSHENIACEHIFLPEKIKYPASKDYSSINKLRSVENKVEPKNFDVLGFSLQYENDLKNVLWIIEKSGIPLNSSTRMLLTNQNNIEYPLVIGGGPVATSNPLPLSKFFDLFFIGDAEPNLDAFLTLVLTHKAGKIGFQDFLNKASLLEGIYVPSLNNKVKRAVLKNLDESPIPKFQLIAESQNGNQIFENNFFIEINRGCPFQCKFCISSFHHSPFRNRSFENIKNSIEEGARHSNCDTISLIGSCVSAHPKFFEICQLIVNKGKRLTIPSIRIDHLTPELIRIFERGNIKTITIAPETGSEELRYQLGKGITNEKIYSVLAELKESKIKNIKFYFLIGLPNEKEEDIDAIVELLKNANEMGFDKKALRVNINPLVPKLNTPYEKAVVSYLKENIRSLFFKYQKLTRELKQNYSIKIKFQNINKIIKEAKLQTILSLGDQNASEFFYNFYLNGANFGVLKKTEKNLNFSIEEYLLKIKNCYSPWKF